MTLFTKRGYDNVTVAEIAEAAGLTRRSFFNYFPDKREIFFSGAAAFRESVAAHLRAATADMAPVWAAADALGRAGDELTEARKHAHAVRAVIASSIELQERDLVKTATLTADVAAVLVERGSQTRDASLAARLAVTAFTVAWEDVLDAPDQPFPDLVRQALVDLHTLLSEKGEI